jgi:hypothetical protein
MAKIKVEAQTTGAGIYTVKSGTSATSYSATLPDATGTLLMTDGDGSSLSGVGGGVTNIDSWDLSGNIGGGAGGSGFAEPISSWTHTLVDGASGLRLGTSMTEASGIFTAPSTGHYQVICTLSQGYVDSTGYTTSYIKTSTDSGATYSNLAKVQRYIGTNGYIQTTLIGFWDVTNTSTHKLRVDVVPDAASSDNYTVGSGRSGIHFIKLADT